MITMMCCGLPHKSPAGNYYYTLPSGQIQFEQNQDWVKTVDAFFDWYSRLLVTKYSPTMSCNCDTAESVTFFSFHLWEHDLDKVAGAVLQTAPSM